ncbi:MAG: type II toxin-antitoxin system HicA family toxin [Acidobacteriota bacterium]
MTPKLPRVTAKEALSALMKAGYVKVRQSGSHQILRNSAGVRITLPVHTGKVLHPAILRTILRDTGLTIEAFTSLL